MPRPLFMKLIAQAAVGFFCVLIGCVYGIQYKDSIFIILSLFIGLCSLIRTCGFYHLIRDESYLVLSGICMKQESMPFKKTRQITFVDENQREYILAPDKDIKLLSGHRYQLYFRQSAISDSGYENYSSADFLGYEELPMVTENIQNSSAN